MTPVAPTIVSDSLHGSASTPAPFECIVCHRRFTRHENLKRHSNLHQNSSSSSSLKCRYCTATFSRRDLRRRHVKRKHPEEAVQADSDENNQAQVPQESPAVVELPPAPQLLSARAGTALDHPAVNNAQQEYRPLHPFQPFTRTDDPPPQPGDASLPPFNFSLPNGDTSNDGESSWSPLDIDKLLQSFSGSTPDQTANAGIASAPTHFSDDYPSRPSISSTSYQSLHYPVPRAMQSDPLADAQSTHMDVLSTSNITRGVDLFFTYASSYCSFIHQPTFSPDAASRPLLLAVLSIGLHFDQDTEQGRRLASGAYIQGKTLLDDEAAWRAELRDSAKTLGIIQSLLLLGLHAVMLASGEETQHGMRLLSKCVELARRGGLMEPYPSQPSRTADLDHLWHTAIRVETHKRTLFAIYLHDAAWYCLLSRPRSLSHLEIKHELPCPEELWTAPNATDWAHRALIASNSSSKQHIRYIDAVRNSLSSGPSFSSLGTDPSGTLLVIMFHYTSVREVSGWSTMTGRTSFERFEALHTALTTLEIAAASTGSTDTMALACEATWHIAMIELSLWSQPHTGGLVEGSLDGALAAATMLIASHPVPVSPEIAESLLPHLVWMLSYLASSTPAQIINEPPWMTVYLFKAALIAWQVVRTVRPDASPGLQIDILSRAGIGPPSEMLGWMKEVFERRVGVWSVGRLVVKALNELDDVLVA